MKRLNLFIIILILTMATLSFAGDSDQEADNEPLYLTFNCMEPMKPMLPMKPYWCTGSWELVLQCDSMCNCRWVPMCFR